MLVAGSTHLTRERDHAALERGELLLDLDLLALESIRIAVVVVRLDARTAGEERTEREQGDEQH